MLKRGAAVLIIICSFTSTSHAEKFSCKVSGGSQSSFKVSKGKIGNFRAKIVGKNIVVSLMEGKLIIKPNGRASLNGAGQGKMQCDMKKVYSVIENG